MGNCATVSVGFPPAGKYETQQQQRRQVMLRQTMSIDAQVTALIRRLIGLNRAERGPSVESSPVNEVHQRKSQKKRIRQKLVQLLDAQHRDTARRLGRI